MAETLGRLLDFGLGSVPVLTTLAILTTCLACTYIYERLDDIRPKLEDRTTNYLCVPSEAMGPDVCRYLLKHRAARRRNIPTRTVLSEMLAYTFRDFHAQHLELVESEEGIHKHALKTVRLTFGQFTDEELRGLYRECFEEHVAKFMKSSHKIVSMRDFFAPMIMQITTRMLFGESLPDEETELFCHALKSFCSVLKLIGRHVGDKHARLFQILNEKLQKNRDRDIIRAITSDPRFSTEEIARNIVSMFYVSAPIQLLEGLTHTSMEIFKNENVLKKLQDSNFDPDYLEMTIKESLRICPLNAAPRRGVVRDIPIPDGMGCDRATVPAGTLVMFLMGRFHRAGWDNPGSFRPERWESVKSDSDVNYLPFGVQGNRPCPAEKFALIFLRECVKLVAQRFVIVTSSRNLRMLPSGGIMMLVERGYAGEHPWFMHLAGFVMRIVDCCDRLKVVLLSLIYYPVCFFLCRRDDISYRRYETLQREGVIRDNRHCYKKFNN